MVQKEWCCSLSIFLWCEGLAVETIRFCCPSCSTTLKVSERAAGKVVRCAKCQKPVTVPNLTMAQAPRQSNGKARFLEPTATVIEELPLGWPVRKGVTDIEPKTITNVDKAVPRKDLKKKSWRMVGVLAAIVVLIVTFILYPKKSVDQSQREVVVSAGDAIAHPAAAVPVRQGMIQPEPVVQVPALPPISRDEQVAIDPPVAATAFEPERQSAALPAGPVEYVMVRASLPSRDGAIGPPPEVERFFKRNLKLTPSKDNLTAQYYRRVPAKKRTPDTLKAFVKEQSIVTDLPDIRFAVTEDKDTPGVLSEYLEAAKNAHTFPSQSLLATCIENLQRGNSSSVGGMVIVARINQETLMKGRVPPSAATLHRLLLGRTELLAATLGLMAAHPSDRVKGEVGFHQFALIEKKYCPIIQQELTRVGRIAKGINAGGGLGIVTDMVNGVSVVMDILPGGAAHTDGRLRPGDKIIAVGQGRDGPWEDVAGLQDSYVAELVKGDPGTIVRVKVLPGDGKKPRRRTVYESPDKKWQRIFQGK